MHHLSFLRKQEQASSDRPESLSLLCLKCNLYPLKQSQRGRAEKEGRKTKLYPATLVPYAFLMILPSNVAKDTFSPKPGNGQAE